MELWKIVMANASVDTWATVVKGGGLLRSAVHQMLHCKIVAALSRFWPTHSLPQLFHALLNVQGLIFGDVPFGILFGQALTNDRLDVVVPLKRVSEVRVLILTTGYKLEEEIGGGEGSENVWLFKHEKVCVLLLCEWKLTKCIETDLHTTA